VVCGLNNGLATHRGTAGVFGCVQLFPTDYTGYAMNKTNTAILLLTLLTTLAAGCSSSDAVSSSAYPSDEQVVRDVTPKNKKGLIAVEVVEGKHGEAYLHPKNLVWYWDRGVVIKREAKVDGAPDAVVVIGGLARYQKMGEQYKYSKFLTTYNSYEGIPEPDTEDLTQYVNDNLKQVFVSRDLSITEISNVELLNKEPWEWHTPNSFSVPFRFRYKEIASNTRIDEREDRIAIRFYRNSLDSPIHALMATEKDRKILSSEIHSEDAVRTMKTLRTAFK
jgi:hypothetical protein